VKLVCLNGWGGKLHSELVSYLALEQPDVLCLQEVVHTPSSNKEWLTYRDGEHVLPQRANFFREIAEALPDYIATFCPAAQGVLWNEDREVASQWGLATYVRASFPIIGQAQGFVHKDYSPRGYGDHPRSRSAHSVRLYDYSKGLAISITHMHGLRDLAGKHDTPERKEQARRLLAFSEQVSEPTDIKIICGDFNVERESDTLNFLKAKGFEELVTAKCFDGTRTSHYSKPGRFADYMFINRPKAVKRFDVVYAPEVSDHCPMVLEI
jgi:endonuclease/exonuclease/phosphatase family metal-dependent hydrolase